jgi:hypothetical protein
METLNPMFQLHVLIRNNKAYLDFTSHEKTNQNVCQLYNKVIYEIINAFMGVQPMLHPLHVYDFVAPKWHHIATIIFQQRNNYVIDFCFHLTKVKCEQVGVMYTT